ncbi:Uncharacterised protein [Mycobacteroides abscessus subsp. abscessus]|nr:Uncharacterised protein [Mycobacteroides abscessus subsp. abscessus]
MSCIADPRWNTTSRRPSSSMTPLTVASAVYSPTE